MRYGPNMENLALMVQKAKDKEDGVYSFRGMEYRVCGGRFTHYTRHGKVFECCGNFVVEIGGYSGYSDDARKMLKQIK